MHNYRYEHKNGFLLIFHQKKEKKTLEKRKIINQTKGSTKHVEIQNKNSKRNVWGTIQKKIEKMIEEKQDLQRCRRYAFVRKKLHFFEQHVSVVA